MYIQHCFPSVLQLLFLSRNFVWPRWIEGRVSFARTRERNSNPLIRQSIPNLRRSSSNHFKRTETPWKPETRWNVWSCENLKSGKIGKFDARWKNFNCREYSTCVWSTELTRLSYLRLQTPPNRHQATSNALKLCYQITRTVGIFEKAKL